MLIVQTGPPLSLIPTAPAARPSFDANNTCLPISFSIPVQASAHLLSRPLPSDADHLSQMKTQWLIFFMAFSETAHWKTMQRFDKHSSPTIGTVNRCRHPTCQIPGRTRDGSAAPGSVGQSAPGRPRGLRSQAGAASETPEW
jgi:hypothetical protein